MPSLALDNALLRTGWADCDTHLMSPVIRDGYQKFRTSARRVLDRLEANGSSSVDDSTGGNDDEHDDGKFDSGVERLSRVFTPSILGGDLSISQQTIQVYSDPDVLKETLATALQTAYDLRTLSGIKNHFQEDLEIAEGGGVRIGLQARERVCYVHMISKDGGQNFLPDELEYDLIDSDLFVRPKDSHGFEAGKYDLLVGVFTQDEEREGVLNLEGDKKVLVLGAGNGRDSIPWAIANKGVQVTLVDLIPENLQKAKVFHEAMLELQPEDEREGHKDVVTLEADFMAADFVEQAGIKGEQFDVINLGLMRTAMHVLNVDNLNGLIKRLSPLLKPGGKIVFDAPLVDCGHDQINYMYQILLERHRKLILQSDVQNRSILEGKVRAFAEEKGLKGENPLGLVHDMEGDAGETRGVFAEGDLLNTFEYRGFDRETVVTQTVELGLTRDEINEWLGMNSIGTKVDGIALETALRYYIASDFGFVDDDSEALFERYSGLFERAARYELESHEIDAYMRAEFFEATDLINKLLDDPVFRNTYFVFTKVE